MALRPEKRPAPLPANVSLVPGSVQWKQAILDGGTNMVRRAMVWTHIDNLLRAQQDEGPQARRAELAIAVEMGKILGIGGPPLSKQRKEEFSVEINAIGRRIWQRRKEERDREYAAGNIQPGDPAFDGDGPVEGVADGEECAKKKNP